MIMENLRMTICKKCPLYYERKGSGPVCSSYLYINPETEEVSLKNKPGYIRGCGCQIPSKVKAKEARCPADKW
jgi:hypothetical protein